MDRVIRILVFFGGILAFSGQNGLLGQKLVFLKTKFDFGEIPESGTIISTSFRFGYSGKTRLNAIDVETSCSCVSAQVFGAPLEPGDSGWVKIVFDPFSRPGPFDFDIRVNAEGATEKLEIKGWVKPKDFTARELFPFESGNIRFKADHLTFDKLLDSKKDTMVTSLFNQGVKVIKLDSKNSIVPKFLKVIPASTIILPGTEVNVTVIYDAALRKNYGFLQDTVVLISNDPLQPKKTLVVSANIQQDFQNVPATAQKPAIAVSPLEADMGKIKKGTEKEVEFRISNSGSAPLTLRRIYSRSSCISVLAYPANILPGKEATVKIKFICDAGTGKMDKSLFIITNDPEKPVTTVTLFGSCVE